MKCSGATGLDISSFPEIKVGGKKKINEMMKKRWAGRKCFISIPFLHRILNCQFGASCFFKGWSGPRASWIWKSKFGSTIWRDLVQCNDKRAEREQASVSKVICLTAGWTMKRQLFWRDAWLHGMALVLMAKRSICTKPSFWFNLDVGGAMAVTWFCM